MREPASSSPLRRTSALGLAFLGFALACSVAFVACGGGDEKESVHAAVQAIQGTINREEPGTAYDRFGAPACKTVPGRDAFVRNYEAEPYKIRELVLLDDNIQINGDRAFLIITANFIQGEGSPEQRTFLETFAKAGGRWRDEDCFQGGLGNVTQVPSGLPGEYTPTPPGTPASTTPGTPGAATPVGTPAAPTPSPASTTPAGTTTAGTPTPAPDGA